MKVTLKGKDNMQCFIIGANFIQNCSLLINKIIQIILSKVFTTFTISGFIHSNSSIDIFLELQLLLPYFLDSLLSLVIKICDQDS